MESKKHELSGELATERHTAVYARNATVSPGQSSLETQVDACVRQAAEDGEPPVVAAYTFRDQGSGVQLDRPGLNDLRQAVQAGVVGVVYVDSPSRLSRNPRHLVLLCQEFTSAGVEIRLVRGSFDGNPPGSLSGLVASVVSAYAHYKAEMPPTLGEWQAGTVRLVFDLARDGWSADEIAAYLNETYPPTGRGGHWGLSSSPDPKE